MVVQVTVADCVQSPHEVLVGDIEDEGILGVDFLSAHNCVTSTGDSTLCSGYRKINLETSRFINSSEQKETLSSLRVLEHVSDSLVVPSYLTELFTRSSRDLDIAQTNSLVCLFNDFKETFAKDSADIGRCTIAKHSIDVGNNAPIKQAARRLPLNGRREVEKLVEDMRTADVIEPSSSPWASPIVLVNKKDGSKRFCIDYRKLNEITKKDAHPLPQIGDTLGSLRLIYRVVIGLGGVWQFKVMPFGLCNAPATFERAMEFTLQGLTGKICLVYLDDIIVFAEGVKTDPSKIEKVLNWPRPDSKAKVQSFLGLCTYYRRFVKGFASIARPLHALTGIKVVFDWTPECEGAFVLLKKLLTSSPILAYPITDSQFIVDSDASLCDNASLTWLLSFKSPEGQVARWLERLGQYDFEIKHRPGVLHGNADALSRRPCGDDCKQCSRLNKQLDPSLNVRQISLVENKEDWIIAQGKDSDLLLVRNWKSTGVRPQWEEISSMSQSLKIYWAQWDSLFLLDQLLYRKWESPDSRSVRWQLLVPREKITEILSSFHDSPVGGHFASNKTSAMMLTGRDLRLPSDLEKSVNPSVTSSQVYFNSVFRQKLDEVHEFARERIRMVSDKTKDRYDIRARNLQFEKGDSVWLFQPRRQQGRCPKLQSNWEGPYFIVDRINDVVFRIRRSPRSKSKVVHLDRLAPYQSRASFQ
ncbi:uncharacterized protein LOC124187364 [Neodiprion fabricii]|uniref:uncharacterized protein LOC124187364 n=1 Tax=Neodiprion fabricii TaxID=2872261 RepID=UPI001ED8E647|nr:uncharacterized protein LOC124187364 [Neodiprion fabricii]